MQPGGDAVAGAAALRGVRRQLHLALAVAAGELNASLFICLRYAYSLPCATAARANPVRNAIAAIFALLADYLSLVAHGMA